MCYTPVFKHRTSLHISCIRWDFPPTGTILILHSFNYICCCMKKMSPGSSLFICHYLCSLYLLLWLLSFICEYCHWVSGACIRGLELHLILSAPKTFSVVVTMDCRGCDISQSCPILYAKWKSACSMFPVGTDRTYNAWSRFCIIQHHWQYWYITI